MKNKVILALFLFFLMFSLNGVNDKDVFLSGVQAYQSRQYDQALEKFRQLENRQVKDTDLFYNIGNCYFKMNRIGLAILYYKKALLYNSSYSAAKKNLNFALKFTRDKQDFDNPNFIVNMIIDVYHIFSLNVLAIIDLILLLTVVYLVHRLIRKKKKYITTVRFLFVLFLILFTLTALWSGIRYYHFENNNEAVILASTVNGYSGPGEDFTKLFTVHEGLIIKLVKQEQGWTQISMPNGLSGWVRSSTFRPITNEK